MKSFIISVIILAVTVAAITVNNIFVTKHLGNVIDSLNELPQGFEVLSADELEQRAKNSLDLFEKRLDFFSYSISARDLRDMHGYLSELYAASTSTDEASYSTALYKALTFAQNLYLRESFNLKNIV